MTAPAPAWRRSDWTALADRILDGARSWASPGGEVIVPPGAEGGYGRRVDGLEGFARTFLLAAFRIAGDHGQGLDDLIAFYARGIAAGVDPDSPERWVRMTERGQAKVEAAPIALGLDLTRRWIWDRLDPLTRQRVIDWLAPPVDDRGYPQTNWLWFRIVTQTFLRSVGGPWSPDEIETDLATLDSFDREGGWIADGGGRGFDHYNAWVLQTYPILWSRMTGAADLAASRLPHYRARLDRFLLDARRLIGGDGSPMIQGRSLIYRSAAAMPFWVGILDGVPSSSPAALRGAAEAIVRHFADRGVPDDRGLLPFGWLTAWPGLAQAYSGPSSSYWTSLGLLGVLLPDDHPVWASDPEPVPATVRDELTVVAAPGWLVSSTADDGIVRIVNHGTDHAEEGDLAAESPFYARFGYSTATFPLLDPDSWREPLDNSIAIVTDAGATHRTGMRLVEARVADDHSAGFAASRWTAHTVRADAEQEGHGSGFDGAATVVATVEACSLARGPWEVRLARVVDGASPSRLRLGGWPLAGDEPAGEVGSAGATVRADGMTSSLELLLGTASPRIDRRSAASPLGQVALTPVLEFEAPTGRWVAALVTLSGSGRADPRAATCSIDGDDVVVRWPDGTETVERLPAGQGSGGERSADLR